MAAAPSASDGAGLEKVLKAISGLVAMAEQGLATRAVADKLLALEAQEDVLRVRLAAGPIDMPDIHPNISEIYRRRVERLAEALHQPEERDEAADAIRALIERVTLTPAARRGQGDATYASGERHLLVASPV